MSESDTMFNERDRRCAAIQLMLSTNQSYDKTTANPLKMQIRTVQRAQGDENKVSGYGYGLWCGFKWGPPHICVKWTWMCWRVWWSPGAIRWRWLTLGVAARLGAGPQVQRDPGLASEGVLWLYPSLTGLTTPPPQPEPAGLLRLVIRREHHQHDLPQHQSQPDRRHPPSSHRRLWKRHALNSGSVSRRWLRLKAATLNRCQLYYIIKLPELIYFSIKVLK